MEILKWDVLCITSFHIYINFIYVQSFKVLMTYIIFETLKIGLFYISLYIVLLYKLTLQLKLLLFVCYSTIQRLHQ